MNELNLAPIVLFVYNRLWHTKQAINALKENELSEQSDLIIYSDAARDSKSLGDVDAVRSFLRTIQGFKKVKIVERQSNFGLAKSIIEGVTDVINEYGKIIVLEDDLVTSPSYLIFMNKALNYYKEKNKVWHISGWNYPIDDEALGDTFIVRLMNCWGWATWSDRWAQFEKNPKRLVRDWDQQRKYHFDVDGSKHFWPQVEANANGKINTWAIFWYSSIYENGGVCLNASISYVENIGFDGSGVHCGNIERKESYKLNLKKDVHFEDNLFESELAIKRIKNYHKKHYKNIFIRGVNKASRLMFGKNIFK